jgi:type II secretory pathway component PulF
MPSEAISLYPLFPGTFASLYASGEVSGKLDDSLRQLNRIYNEDGTRKLDAFATWTPRLVYLLVAVLIACKVVQFWAGLYGSHSDLSNVLKGF